MSLHRSPRLLLVLGLAAGLLALVLTAPDSALYLLAKEGPVEHLSHLVLLAAVLTWLLLTRRADPTTRPRIVLMVGFLALVLAEELDWGAVYGWHLLAPRIAAFAGHRNLHNAARGASYLLFAAPLLLYFFAPPVHRGIAPSPDERAAFLAIALLFLAWNFGPWERQAQELLETLLYALLLAIALRLIRR